MAKKIAILQSNYIPWKGYFDLINFVDEFVLYDCVQYTKNDWRNRNIIKTINGAQWLTIPVTHNSLTQKIYETQIKFNNWNKKHWQSILTNYSKTKCFKKYSDVFETTYKFFDSVIYLSEINTILIKIINEILEINTIIKSYKDYTFEGDRNERLIQICKQANSDIYVTGPAANNYLDYDMFAKNDIKIEVFKYDNYPEYFQLFPPFIHNVTVLDLIFNEGQNAKNYLITNK